MEETRVFIPASLVSDTFEKNLTKYEVRKLNSLSQSSTREEEESSVTAKQLLVADKSRTAESIISSEFPLVMCRRYS